MANGRHSYVAFYPSDWLAGTALMRSRIMRSIYFDVCLYNWDTGRACPPFELEIMLGDVRDWKRQVDQLIAMGKLARNDDGSIENPKAMAEAAKAMSLHAAKSAGGRASKTVGKSADKTPAKTPPIELEPEPELDNAGALSPRKRAKSVPVLAPKPNEVDQQIWDDFQIHRKKKGAPVTVTALNGIASQAVKAGISLGEALAVCCRRGWQGFEADWYLKEARNGQRFDDDRGPTERAIADWAGGARQG